LRIRHANGRRVSIPVDVQVTLGTNSWSTHYRAQFRDGRREALTVIRFMDAPPEFRLVRVSADGRASEAMPQRPEELYRPFATTDFWVADLGMVFLHWPDQRWVGRETRRTRVCNILQSVNPTPGSGEYRRVLTWVDDETGGIIRAEAYDASNRLVKEFSPGSFARVGSRYELRELEIRSERTDSRTTLEFAIDDPKKLGIEPLPQGN
jgi:hypothetical protein